MEHPITPPPELVQQWFLAARAMPVNQWVTDVATAAAQWGWEQRGAANEAELQQARDEELNACCEWLDFYSSATNARDLRLACRPKPPSLKEQALAELEEIMTELDDETESAFPASAIRRALETLPND